MSLTGITSQSAYPDEFSDSMAELTARIVQEQLAPILETLKEHAKLLDLHAALLNHSTAMNRYNVGKLDDIRDFQSNINFKLQYYIDPEERKYPTYRNPRAPVPPQRTEETADIASRLPGSAPDPSDEPTESSVDAPPSTTTTNAPGSQDPPSSPGTVTEAATSPPSSPRFTGEGFAVIPGSSRILQRERPFSVQPDPMWNSSLSINPFLRLAAPPPPPPYMLPPAYTTEDPAAPRAESQAATLTAERASPTPSSVPATAPVPRPDSEAAAEVSAETRIDDTADNPLPTPSPSPPSTATISAEGSAGAPQGANDPDDIAPSSQLSEKARGKKRMREEDSSSPDEDVDEDDPFAAAGCSNSGRDGRSRKRQKTDTRISTDRLDLSPSRTDGRHTSFMDKLLTMTDRRHNVEKLKYIEKVYRGGR